MRNTRVLLSVALLAIALPVVPVCAQETVEYYGVDALGSVRAVFAANGAVVARHDYEPFGKPVTPPTSDPKIFAGLFRDDESQLEAAQARMYQSRTGRFTTVDPVFDGLFDPQRWNRYSYALNNPLAFVDPSGRNAAACDPNTCTTVIGHAPDIPLDMLFFFLGFYGGGFGGGGGGSSDDGGGGGGQLRPVPPLPTAPASPPEEPIIPPIISKSPKVEAQIKKAFTEVNKRLQRPQCSAFFGGEDTARTLLGSIPNVRVVPMGGPHPGSTGGYTVTSAATNPDHSIFINSQGAFFNQNLFIPGGPSNQVFDAGTGLRGTNFQALLLLHELGHVSGMFGPDANQASVNASYTNMVRRACF